MNVREAVKDKANYGGIVTYFQSINEFSLEHLVLLIDIIDEMSEEIFEHYRALHMVFRGRVAEIITKRREMGDFSFLTDPEQESLSYAIEKAGWLGVLLWEKYEGFDRELKNKYSGR